MTVISEATWDQVRDLVEADVAADHDEATTALEAARAELNAARLTLEAERAAERLEDAEETALRAELVTLTSDKAALERLVDQLSGKLKDWTPVLEEQFLGPLDTKVWTAKDKTSSSNESSYLLARNLAVAAGFATFTARKESVGGKAFTSAYITTGGKVSLPDYRRVEVRALLPIQQGMWAAPAWSRPYPSIGAYESDVVETYGNHDGQGNYTLHAGDTYDPGKHYQIAITRPLAAPASWHVFAQEFRKGLVVSYVDDVEVARFTPASKWSMPGVDPAPAAKANAALWAKAFDAGRAWDVRCNLQVGGKWGGPPDATTEWDKTSMVLDYVRAWKLAA